MNGIIDVGRFATCALVGKGSMPVARDRGRPGLVDGRGTARDHTVTVPAPGAVQPAHRW
jgi:hypothetical protein